MQLYNTLSAEERVMIDDAGKQRLTLSFYAYAQIQIQLNFETIYSVLGILSSSRPNLCSQRRSMRNYHCLPIILCLQGHA
jgi:hypothetical protein